MQEFGSDSTAYNAFGVSLMRQGGYEEAIEYFRRTTELNPNSAEAFNNLGLALGALRRFAEAARNFERARDIEPSFIAAHNNLGVALEKTERRQEAARAFEAALVVDPNYQPAHRNLGAVYRGLGRFDDALQHLRRALELKPDDAEAHNHLGITLAELDRDEEAIAYYSAALKIDQHFADAHSNLGNALRRLGQRDEAIASYARALQIDPRSAIALNNLGLALRETGRRAEAVECFKSAVEIDPAFAEAHSNLGVVFADLRWPQEAVASFTEALKLKPDYALARAQRLHQLARLCDWDAIAKESADIPGLGVSGGIVSPFALLAIEDAPARHRIRAERFAAQTYGVGASPMFARPAARPERLRIGYFSADFKEHATMHLMARLFEVHDRRRFSIHGYSFGPSKDDAMRLRVSKTFDTFHDVNALSDTAAAELARNHEIDIAVDLKGYTESNRAGIFAHRAAPVQISFLGYPGTMGASFIDYLVADDVLILERLRKHYSESIIYLPHSYQVNDNTRPIAARTPSRDEVGLPSDGFVFCCFSGNYKITPTEFDIWMSLLRRVDKSVLWLLAANDTAERNLRNQASRRGVDPRRIIFAGRLPQAEHLARQPLADLFLDTFVCNAHTTASDALWAGLPIVTKPGESMIARVAASVLHAIGLSELVTDSVEAYAALALELATDPVRLNEVRQKLHANRLSAPLFNTELFARHIEQAYDEAHSRYRSRQTAETIRIEP